MAIAKGASALVLNEKGEVLITQRQDLQIWVFPGGAISEKEIPEEAAKREVEEETGIKIEIQRLVGIYVTDHPLRKSITLFFLAKKTGGRIKRQKGEVLRVRWVKKQALSKFLSKRHYQRLKEAFSNEKRIKLIVKKQLPFPLYKLSLFLVAKESWEEIRASQSLNFKWLPE